MTTKRWGALAMALCLAGSAAGAAHADTVLDGSADGAFFRIVVPTVWNGDLVIYNHGFSLTPPAPVTDLGPLAPLQLQQGFAVAASSYRQLGWALFATKQDEVALFNAFKTNFGKPKRTFVNGASLGGLVTAQALEQADLGTQAGSFPFCGALAGSRSWDGALDLRLVYDNVCAGVAGAAIPGGATGLPAPGFPLYPFTETNLALAVNACTGILAPPAARTPDQSARLAKILAVTTIPESFLLTDMGFATFALSNLIHAPEKLAGKQGVGNIGVKYPDAQINQTIQRVSANKQAAQRLKTFFTPSCDAPKNSKILTLHTDKDGLVVVEQEQPYKALISASKLTQAVVVEAAPSHCGFTQGELVAGWESLRSWVGAPGAPGVKPGPAQVQGLCSALVAGGAVAGPCRIDPAYVIKKLDTRILKRP
jgi:hypothetical protein